MIEKPKEKIKIPVFQEDFEEITQTIEDGIIVSESSRVVKSPNMISQTNPDSSEVQKFHRRKPQAVDDLAASFENSELENNETQDIAEEQEGSQSGVQTAYIKTRNKHNLFEEKDKHNNEPVNSKTQEVGNTALASSRRETSQPDRVSLLEESQEVVMFQPDSKLSSPNMSINHTKESMVKSDHSNNPKEETKGSFKDLIRGEIIYEEDHNKDNSHGLVQEYRDSPGPKKNTITASLSKKEIEDSGSNEEPMYSDEMSNSSGDILPNTEDIK